MLTPFDLSWTELLLRRNRLWPTADVVLLKVAFVMQRAVELWGRRPCDAPGSIGAIARRRCAVVVERLPIRDRRLVGWRDAIALDLADTARRIGPVEVRIRERLMSAPSAAAGDAIVMVIPSLGVGGAEGQMVQLALALNRSGRAVRVVVKHFGEQRFDALREKLESHGILVLPISRDSEARQFASSIPEIDPDLHRLASALIGVFQHQQLGVVHAWMDEMGTAAALAAVLCGVPRVIIDCRSLRPTWFETRGVGSIRAALRTLVQAPGVHLVNNSTAGADDYRRWLEIDCRIDVVRNAIDVTPFTATQPHCAQWGHWVVGGVMRLSHAKRPDLWFDIARRFIAEHPDAQFWLFGDGPLRPRLERRIRRYGMQERVFLKGLVLDKIEAMSNLDALLVTSDVEGTPNVVLEAQAMGVPVVARPVGGLPAAIAPELASLLATTESGLLAALRDAVTMNRGRLAQAGRQFVQAEFDPGRQLNEYLRLYSA